MRSSYTTPFYLLLLFFLNFSLSLSELLNDFAVNCGSSGNFNGNYNQKWIGDIGSKFLSTSQGSKATSVKSKIAHLPYFVPYTSARISYKQFSYRFEVDSGQKFIRLHFYPTTYTNFEKSNDFFTVKAGPYTLLSNFSASLTADVAGVRYFTKEYCIDVGENKILTLTISPTIGGSGGRAYAFVNGIEIISMPPGLYYTPVGELGINVVGKKYQLWVDENIALEMVHRLNVGGSSILPIEDTGFSREWSGDSNYFVNSDFQPVSTSTRIKYKSIPSYTAPQKVYQTSWATVSTKQSDKVYNFTWKLPVDLGFRYLIRFHFCELEYEIEESSCLRFSIIINDQIAVANTNIIEWSGGSGIAVFKDYAALMEGDRMEGKRDLTVSLIPKWNETTDTILKGLEIFKLSNTDNNLAGMNPTPITRYLNSTKRSPRKFVYAHGGNLISTVIIILISLVSIIVYQLRILGEKYGETNIISASPSEGHSRRFSLAEVRLATNDFDNLSVIGRGGFGLVYKGVIDNGTIIVAIKRLNSKSKQGADEFWTEIEMLSKLRHTHLVSLIGYCKEGEEMILVYEYMEHGTLADHLYKIRNKNGIDFNLSWEQKLNICIGAARGLDYLHTSTRHGVIHRDVKTTNILLDNEWVAKISDFGLCKVGATNHSCTHVSTDVKGSFGYFDPDYFLTRRLTKKSDVYAFGVVLLEVLSGRPAVDLSLSEDRHSLVLWGQHCIKEGNFDDLIGPDLQDQISSPCLKIFTEVAYKCLHNRPNGRPTMSDVVVSLESAIMSGEATETRYLNASNREMCTPNEPQNSLKKDPCQLLKFTFQELKSATRNFRPSKQLEISHYSEGGFGIVFKGWIEENGTGPAKLGSGITVAVKSFTPGSGQCNEKWAAEVDFLGRLHHPNLVKLIGYCNEDDQRLLVYEFMTQGSLENHLFRTISLPWSKRIKIALGAAKGLAFLHEGTEPVIFRDFKTSNILLDIEYNAKLSNFSLAKAGPEGDDTHVSTRVMGTCGYAAPEYVATGHLYPKSDVYSFGVVLLEILTGRRSMDRQRPNNEQNLVDWARPYLADKRKIYQIVDPRLKLNYSLKGVKNIAYLANNCLSRDLKSRPSMDEVVNLLTLVQEFSDFANLSYHSRLSQQVKRKKKLLGIY